MKNNGQYYFGYLSTPIGLLEVCANDRAITSIGFSDIRRENTQANEHTEQAVSQLEAYFDGKLSTFRLVLGATGTDFQRQVWQALSDIPFGTTCSYADIANQIHNPKAVRAVGAANGKNPLSIVVPCHRVIGKNGTLTGYAGGLDRKSWLLEFEKNKGKLL